MEGVPASATAIAGLFILLPGFISLFIERSLAYEREQSGTVLVGKALVYSFVNYAFVVVARLVFVPCRPAGSVGAAEWMHTWLRPEDAVPLLLLSFATGVIGGTSKAHNWHMEAAQRLGLTIRSSRTGIWSATSICSRRIPGRM